MRATAPESLSRLGLWDGYPRYVTDGKLQVLSITQSINTFIMRHGTEARTTVRIMPKQREMS